MGCGRMVRKYRAENGVTQVELATKTGLDRRTIINIEADHPPSIDTAKKLAAVLGVEWPSLIDA